MLNIIHRITKISGLTSQIPETGRGFRKQVVQILTVEARKWSPLGYDLPQGTESKAELCHFKAALSALIMVSC